MSMGSRRRSQSERSVDDGDPPVLGLRERADRVRCMP
jgi:hypothetical protein